MNKTLKAIIKAVTTFVLLVILMHHVQHFTPLTTKLVFSGFLTILLFAYYMVSFKQFISFMKHQMSMFYLWIGTCIFFIPFMYFMGSEWGISDPTGQFVVWHWIYFSWGFTTWIIGSIFISDGLQREKRNIQEAEKNKELESVDYVVIRSVIRDNCMDLNIMLLDEKNVDWNKVDKINTTIKTELSNLKTKVKFEKERTISGK